MYLKFQTEFYDESLNSYLNQTLRFDFSGLDSLTPYLLDGLYCPPGIGRSGSFILVDSCLLQAENEGPAVVNVRQTLLNMRTFR